MKTRHNIFIFIISAVFADIDVLNSEGDYGDSDLDETVRKIVKFPTENFGDNESVSQTVEPEVFYIDPEQSESTEDDVLYDDYKPKKVLPNSPTFYYWGNWSEWSPCSRSCGFGVKMRKRNCTVSNTLNSGEETHEFEPSANSSYIGCVGLYKRYRLCINMPCNDSNSDFRTEQCSKYNDIPYYGRKYQWEGYIQTNNECVLTCKPKGYNYYAVFNATVVDGTFCRRPAIYYTHKYRRNAVCVEGICKAVHSKGLIRGATTYDSAHRCGSILCQPISEIFTKNPLPHGYFHVDTIPAGSTNVSIIELENSDNLLVLKSNTNKFIINGPKNLSQTGTYKYHGNVFNYEAQNVLGNLEKISADGFLTEPVDLMIFVRGNNPGIKYEYFVARSFNNAPNSEVQNNDVGPSPDYGDDDYIVTNQQEFTDELQPSEKRKGKFMWKLVGFAPCTKSCGGGYQAPIFRCIREPMFRRFYSPRRCRHLEKPVFNEAIFRCNSALCPAYWRIERWGECSCLDGKGYQERIVKCVQQLNTGVVTKIDDVLQCKEDKPETRKRCRCYKQIRKRGSQKSEDLRVHAHSQEPQFIISLNKTFDAAAFKDQSDKSGIWLMSSWNGDCSAECGLGIEYRTIFCDRTYPSTERCNLRITPATNRQCKNEEKCQTAIWVTGQWGECEGDCFSLTKRRKVLCIRNNQVVSEEECPPDSKPEDTKSCNMHNVSFCGPRWHYSEWSKCSKSCGGGTQRRFVKCLEYDFEENVLKESGNCLYAEREPIYSTCNNQNCPEVIIDLIEHPQTNDIVICEDKFSNCQFINKQRLCGLKYYERYCCRTCSS